MKATVWLMLLILLVNLAGCGTGQAGAPEEGFVFSYKELEISLHEEAAPVVEALGAPMGYTEEASCAFQGLDKTYYYGSFYLSTYPLEETDRVYRIWFADDSVSTAEGIRIGSCRQEVADAYGADALGDGNACVLTKGHTKLTILLSGDTVSSIQYEAVVE